MPAAKSVDFEDRVIELCRKHRIDLVIPIVDYEFFGWCEVAASLREMGTRVVISPRQALCQCIEKDKTHEYFRSLGVPAIPTCRTGEIADPAALAFPVYLKPRCGRASLDNYKADNLDEYQVVVRKVPDALVQPFTRGVEVTIDTLSDLDGRFLAASPRVRLEVKSGQAYRSRTFADPDLTATAKRIVEGLPLLAQPTSNASSRKMARVSSRSTLALGPAPSFRLPRE